MIDTTHWFWWSITAFTVVWYSTITVYVTFRGASDIHDMLKRLQAGADDPASTEEKKILDSDSVHPK